MKLLIAVFEDHHQYDYYYRYISIYFEEMLGSNIISCLYLCLLNTCDYMRINIHQ